MYTDMIGYTVLGQRNESLSLALADEQRRLIRPILNKHNGREVKTMGDGFLVEFASALEAARCAYDIQRTIRESNLSVPEERRLHLRVGIHLGDVVEEYGDISGDAVNVASRIEPLAEDGGVCITRQVYDHLINKFELPLMSMGSKPLKNVNMPVEVYKMVMPWEEKNLTTAGHVDAKKIAVLPFANMSPDPADSYFADGITEEVISTLSGLSGLRVISRTSVMGYKGTTKKAKDIGRELEVGSLLEGSLRKAGSRIRVTVQLISVSEDEHVWAQSYDRELDDIFAVQSDIAKQVVEALRVRILKPEVGRLDRTPTLSTKAYTSYLIGRYHWNKRTVESIQKAIESFEQAVMEDNNFALGYAGLADCHEILATNWELDKTNNHNMAKAQLTKALELEPDLAEAHATRGLLLSGDFGFREAEKEFRKAIELKPSYASAHFWLYLLLNAQSRDDEAFNEIEKAVELDPISPIINSSLGHFYVHKRDYEKAIEIHKKTSDLDPSNPFYHYILALDYGKLKRFDEAKGEMRLAVELSRESYPHFEKVAEANLAYLVGDKQLVRRLLPELEALPAGGMMGSRAPHIAAFFFWLGEKEKGFEWLERSYSNKDFLLIMLKDDERFDSVRTDMRFVDFFRRIGLESES